MSQEIGASIAAEVFCISSAQEFNDQALRLFHHQMKYNAVYRGFVEHLNRPIPSDFTEIPCLPIAAFKSHQVLASEAEVQRVFRSSGTTGLERSAHHLVDVGLYEQSFTRGFEHFYGAAADYCILGLLPNYLEQGDSSLVYMVDQLIQRSGHPASGFYLDDHAGLHEQLKELQMSGQKTLLIGVTYALLDFVEAFPMDFPELIVMETGGMKGRRKELIREEVHRLLQTGFHIPAVHSEYGMTELLSQAYSAGKGIFDTAPWMHVLIRDVHDPLARVAPGKTGGVDIIDLANVHSCPFIATQDLGKAHADGTFEVLGRFDHSDVRGCSLLV